MKNFLIHLSMTLGFSINPSLWFKTKHYKLRKDDAPQHLTKNDLATMIEQLVCIGDLSHEQADHIYDQLDRYSDIDLKRIIVRGMNNQDQLDQWRRDSLPIDENHDHDEDLKLAVTLFQNYMRERVQ